MSSETFLRTELALIQAPMAGVQDARLALAASGSGALGSLPAAMLDAAALQREMQVLHDAGRPYNVNFFVHVPPAPDAEVEARWRSVLAPYYAEFGIDPSTVTAGASRRPCGPPAAPVRE